MGGTCATHAEKYVKNVSKKVSREETNLETWA
jgi:hypothetical protein